MDVPTDVEVAERVVQVEDAVVGHRERDHQQQEDYVADGQAR